MSAIQTLLNDVQNAVSKNRIDGAFKLLQALPDDHPQTGEVSLISKQWEKQSGTAGLGSSVFSDENLIHNQVAARLLEVVGEIKNAVAILGTPPLVMAGGHPCVKKEVKQNSTSGRRGCLRQ